MTYNFIYKNETESTSTDIRELIKENVPEGVVVVAARQTGGRGRSGKSFFSPDGGVYFSALLKPKAEDAAFITQAAAVATLKAIDKLCRKKCGIKWVNDLYFDNKKVCGILCEAVMRGGKFYVILGIGINLLPPEGGFPDEIKEVAGALFDEGDDVSLIKKQLPQTILDIFYDYYENFESRSFLKEYRDNSIMSGKRIIVFKNEGNYEATAIEIDENSHLVIKKDNGEVEKLLSGEISIKFKGM